MKQRGKILLFGIMLVSLLILSSNISIAQTSDTLGQGASKTTLDCSKECKKVLVVFVHGVGSRKFDTPEWQVIQKEVASLGKSYNFDYLFYTYNDTWWAGMGGGKSWDELVSDFSNTINAKKAANHYDKIIIFAHSAGGVISSDSLGHLDNSVRCDETSIELYTVASPLVYRPGYTYAPILPEKFPSSIIGKILLMPLKPLAYGPRSKFEVSMSRIFFSPSTISKISSSKGGWPMPKNVKVTHYVTGSDGAVRSFQQPDFDYPGVIGATIDARYTGLDHYAPLKFAVLDTLPPLVSKYSEKDPTCKVA